MVIPRENKLVRLYIQLNEVNATGKPVDRSQLSPDMILESAQKIMSPYTLTYKYCDWWTAYQVWTLAIMFTVATDMGFSRSDSELETNSPVMIAFFLRGMRSTPTHQRQGKV